MNPPDYTKYSISELFQALNGIDQDRHKERTQVIKDEIKHRQEAGYVISAETSSLFNHASVSFYDIAMPVWWSMFWRTTVASLLFFLLLWFVLVLTKNIGMSEEFMRIFIGLTQLASVPFIGAYCMRQALVSRYKSFQISIVPSSANKSLQPTAEASAE